MKRLYQSLMNKLVQGQSVVSATIFHRSGSAPRSAGAKMLVCPDGSMYGTVGGGRLEADTIRLARQVLVSRQSHIQPFDLTATAAAGTGMICGGQGEILIDYIDAGSDDNRKIYAAILTAIDQAEKAWLITEIAESQNRQARQQCLVKHDGTVVGCFVCDAEFMSKISQGPAKLSIHADAREGRRYVVEPIRAADVVYLFGAGHVSAQIAALTDRVGFKTVVLDDRPDFANKERFPHADVIVVDCFEHLPELNINKNSYLVVVTRGHLYDSIVLEQIVRTGAAYIGMIGSKSKRDNLYQSLQKKGFSAAELNKVHSPIGIDIWAETPEEIAISIVAELIKTRAERENAR